MFYLQIAYFQSGAEGFELTPSAVQEHIAIFQSFLPRPVNRLI
jgi:hypothetical protein